VVVGTNGTRLTDARIESLMEAGVQGVAVSVDSLGPTYHDRFRHGNGALSDTLAAVERLGRHGLDFIVQTSLTRGNRDELTALVAWSAEMGAVAFNLYFLVPTGRGEGWKGSHPGENEEVLGSCSTLEARYRGRMMVRSKCQPQLMRHAHAEGDPASPLLNYGPAVPLRRPVLPHHPRGEGHALPLHAAVAGDLSKPALRHVWRDSPVFRRSAKARWAGSAGAAPTARCAADAGPAPTPSRATSWPRPPAPTSPTGSSPRAAPATRDLRRPAPRARPALDRRSPKARVARIPSFVRGVVTERVERFARSAGAERSTRRSWPRCAEEMPVDFSRRLPFFLRRGGEA
jgi:AdoMet-dependent heme synthase